MSPEQSTWAETGTVHGDHTELSCPAAVFVKQISAKGFQPKPVGLREATRAGEKRAIFAENMAILGSVSVSYRHCEVLSVE